jgi:hypothetical protein
MSKKEFDDFIKQKQEEQKTASAIDWEVEKKDWLTYVEILYKLFEDSMKDYSEKGLVKIKYDEIGIVEEKIGSYKAKRMTIDIAGDIVVLKPIGTNLIAAKGRVDMSGKYGTTKIVLVDSRMKALSDHIKVTVYAADKPPKEEAPKDKAPITWEWKFVTSPPTRKYQPVNVDTIYSAIMELANGN